MKNEDVWNRILLVVEPGDIVRLKHGKAQWTVLAVGTVDGRQWIKLWRMRHPRKGFPYSVYKEIWQGTREYRNLRIVKPKGGVRK